MELKEAQEILSKFSEAVSRVDTEINYRKNWESVAQKREEQLNLLKKENSDLKRDFKLFKSKYELLANHPDNPIQICPHCDGDGGFTWETEFGGDGEQCNVCEGAGTIEKTEAQKESVKPNIDIGKEPF